MSFSETMFKYHRAESDLSDALSDAGFGDYEKISGDYYDNSIEFHSVMDDARMNEAAQRIVFDAGFSKAYVNHKDSWETHYNWNHSKPFAPSRGWRRRWVADPTSETTNHIGVPVQPDNAGYFEISFWPEGWNSPMSEGWKENGYMRIVPDPLETATANR